MRDLAGDHIDLVCKGHPRSACRHTAHRASSNVRMGAVADRGAHLQHVVGALHEDGVDVDDGDIVCLPSQPLGNADAHCPAPQ